MALVPGLLSAYLFVSIFRSGFCCGESSGKCGLQFRTRHGPLRIKAELFPLYRYTSKGKSVGRWLSLLTLPVPVSTVGTSYYLKSTVPVLGKEQTSRALVDLIVSLSCWCKLNLMCLID
jgi:hypothetical protein